MKSPDHRQRNMAQAALETSPMIIPFARLYQPPETGETHRTKYPMRRRIKPSGDQKSLWESRLDPDVTKVAESIREEFRDPVVPELQRQYIRENMTLRQFYEDWMLADREKRVVDGNLAGGTLVKDRSALERWERFTRPDYWPADKEWPGLPLGAITGRYIASVFERMRSAKLKDATIRSTWNHLRVMLNHAGRVRGLDVVPRPAPRKWEEEDSRAYEDDDLPRAYLSLKEHPDLQVAFVLACNAGMRPVDLFRLRWDDFQLSGPRPRVAFFAKKTRKDQTVPLAPVTIKQLERLSSRGTSPYLFPGRCNPTAKDTEKSESARERNRITKACLSAVGLDYPKPWQAARATCNSRLETAREGAGVFVLGHGLTLNAKRYNRPSRLIFLAVNEVEQPACFWEF